MPYNCKQECSKPHIRPKYKITNGLPPSIKNRDLKQKCRVCCVWMIIKGNRCFCCGNMLTKKKNSNYPTSNNQPTFKQLGMIPIHVEKYLRKW